MSNFLTYNGKFIKTSSNAFVTSPSSTPSPSWSPTSISGLNLWLDASQGISETGGAVSQWDDQSGNGFNAVQLTGDNQPLLTGSTEFNNLPVIRFDGSNDYLQTSLPQINSPFTIFIIYSMPLGAFGYRSTIYGSGDNNVTMWYDWYYYFVGQQLTHYNGGSMQQGYQITTPNTEINTTIYNGGTSYSYSNGELKASLNFGGLSLSNFIIGQMGTQFDAGLFKGDIAEILIYNTALNDTDRLLVETYLNTKYVIY